MVLKNLCLSSPGRLFRVSPILPSVPGLELKLETLLPCPKCGITCLWCLQGAQTSERPALNHFYESGLSVWMTSVRCGSAPGVCFDIKEGFFALRGIPPSPVPVSDPPEQRWAHSNRLEELCLSGFPCLSEWLKGLNRVSCLTPAAVGKFLEVNNLENKQNPNATPPTCSLGFLAVWVLLFWINRALALINTNKV